MATLNIDGINRLIEQSRQLKYGVAIPELMTDGFIQKHSHFENFQALVDASELKSLDEAEGSEFSKFISANTRFDNWEEMLQATVIEYLN